MAEDTRPPRFRRQQGQNTSTLPPPPRFEDGPLPNNSTLGVPPRFQTKTPVASTLQPVDVSPLVAQGGPTGQQFLVQNVPSPLSGATVGVVEPFGSGSDVSLGSPPVGPRDAAFTRGGGGGGGGGAGGLLATIAQLRGEGEAEIAGALQQNLDAIDVARTQYGDAVLASDAVRRSNVARVLEGLDETATGRAADLRAQGVTGSAGQAAFDAVRATIEGMGVSQDQLSQRFAEIQEGIFSDFELSAQQVSQVSRDALAATSLQAEIAIRSRGSGGGGGGRGRKAESAETKAMAVQTLMAEGIPMGVAIGIVEESWNAGTTNALVGKYLNDGEVESADPLQFAYEAGLVDIHPESGGFALPDGTPVNDDVAGILGTQRLRELEQQQAAQEIFAARQPRSSTTIRGLG